MGTENGTPGNAAQNATNGNGRVKQVLAGCVSGVAAGFVLTAFAAIYQAYNHAHERREQIAFFRDWVNTMQMYCEDTEGLESGQHKYSADAIRRYRLLVHVRLLRSALDGRSARLTFDEINEIDQAYYPIQISLDLPDFLISKENCSGLLSNFDATWANPDSGLRLRSV